MHDIEKIWESGNEGSSREETFNAEFIKKSISESSIGISSKLLKTIWMGVVIVSLAGIAFTYNLFFYYQNAAMLITIIALIALSTAVFIFLTRQAGIVKKSDTENIDLKSLLVFKIKFLETKYYMVLHCLALSVVLATFAINLTMENADGIFEFRKILILSAFYVFAYLIVFYLSKITHSVYIKQMKNALYSLEENQLHNINEELKKHRIIRKIILGIIIAALITGLIAFLTITGT